MVLNLEISHSATKSVSILLLAIYFCFALVSPVIAAAPSALSDTILSATSVKLDWSDNTADETAFVVERKPATGAYAQIGSVGANITTFSDSGVTAGTNYCYHVYAQTPGGNCCSK